MTFLNKVRGGLLAAAAWSILILVPATAQEVSDSHLKQAFRAISAINATDSFDGILPEIALILKQELIQKDPDIQPLISTTVDEKTIGMASRRGDLEREAALAYAKAFSEEELKTISDFYDSAVGRKLIEEGPIVTRQLGEAANIWQRGVARDLAILVGQTLESITKQQTETGSETETESGTDN